MKITSCRVHVPPVGPGPLSSNSLICSMSISPVVTFFQSVLPRKNWQGGGELLLKNCTIDGYVLTNHVIDRAGFTLCGAPGTLEILAKSFIAKKGEDQKKNSYQLSAESLALCHMINSALVIALRS